MPAIPAFRVCRQISIHFFGDIRGQFPVHGLIDPPDNFQRLRFEIMVHDINEAVGSPVAHRNGLIKRGGPLLHAVGSNGMGVYHVAEGAAKHHRIT